MVLYHSQMGRHMIDNKTMLLLLFVEENSPRQDLTSSSPLPAIPTVQKVELPECPIVVVIGKEKALNQA